MSPEAREALEASIAHWQENVAATSPEEASTIADDCALCRRFNSDGLYPICEGCPVMAQTGQVLCCGTPYTRANRLLNMWRVDPRNTKLAAEWRVAAQAELDFLISLREETDE